MNARIAWSRHLQKVQGKLHNRVRTVLLSFINAISSEMKTSGISKSQMADSLEVSRPYITKVLRGEENMTVESLVKLATVLECDVSIQIRKRQPEKKIDNARPRVCTTGGAPLLRPCRFA